MIPIIPSNSHNEYAQQLAHEWNFEFRATTPNDIFFLEIAHDRLQLRKQAEPKLGAIYVDFLADTLTYRRNLGGGRSQPIAKAIGLKHGKNPTVIDATAGLGRDAFILSALGCRVHMIERSAIVAALLKDGLERAQNDSRINVWVSERLSLEFNDSHNAFANLPFSPDVVYLDPMFPEKKKAALVKKEMQIFKELIGPDQDSEELLNLALTIAQNRVVVKRPAYAPCLGNQKPHTAIITKKNRFDVYMIHTQ